jgi:uncharacterized membrane protein YkvA (DUF1232 family)
MLGLLGLRIFEATGTDIADLGEEHGLQVVGKGRRIVLVPITGGGSAVTGSFWWDLLIGITAALLLAWLALVVVLLITRPRGSLLREALRLLPDVLRLVRRLAADKTLPPGVRIRLSLLLAYLAIPIDPIPDFIPVLGYTDDAIIVTVVLRSVVRRAGLDAVRAHWPGTDDGFAAVVRITGLHRQTRGSG